MKKIILCLIGIFSFFFLCSCDKNVPAELVIMNEDKQEQTIKITTTENKDELLVLFDQLKKAKLNPIQFSGVSLSITSKIKGKMSIGEEDKTNIDLNYDIHMETIASLKKYILSGKVTLEGYTKTDSLNLSLNAKQKLLANVINDDDNLYVNYSFETEGIKSKAKKKLDISSFTEEYKIKIMNALDILKYYNPITLFPELESYVTAVSATKKNSFTLKLSIPTENTFIDCFIELSCQNLMPIHFKINLDEVLIEELEREYLDKYVGQPVYVEDALFTIEASLDYGNYSIMPLTEEEKDTYSYFN
ncbi:MAG TPA: hypothetical protein PKV66_03700 [Candidatus Pelethenecus sp.]|nr:hypothetical protein [Candidatus Pelethenecus sp.]